MGQTTIKKSKQENHHTSIQQKKKNNRIPETSEEDISKTPRRVSHPCRSQLIDTNQHSTIMKLIDKVYLWYFIIHIPITIFIDSSIVIPEQYQLSITKSILNFHITTNNDILLAYPQTWFKIFGFVELVFQLPLFFYFIYKLLSPNSLDVNYYLWSMIYGFNAGFTTFVCLIWLIIEYRNFQLLDYQLINLLAIYTPYLLLPLILLIHSFKQIQLYSSSNNKLKQQ